MTDSAATPAAPPAAPAPVTPAPLIQAVGVRRHAGAREILAGVDLALAPGQVALLTGANGAGKTTLLKVLALLQKPSSGRVAIAGRDARAHGPALRRFLGVVLHEPLLYPRLTAAENLHFYGRLYGLGGVALRQRVDTLLHRAGLAPYGREPVATFSRGMQQRLTLVRSLLHRPPVLLWDEPLAALDGEGAGLVQALLEEHRRAGGCALAITHQREPLAGVATGVLTLAGGRLREVRA